MLLHAGCKSEYVPVHVVAIETTCESLDAGRRFVIRVEETDLIHFLHHVVGDHRGCSVIVGIRVVLGFLTEIASK